MAENETTVGTVVATDADASDSISGYAISGGADQGKFSIDTNGALTFKSAPNYEAPTDAGTDNTYAVAVTATSGTSPRVLTATQAITVTVTDVNEPPSAPATPTISAVTASGFTVSWTAPANPGPAITAYAVQYRVSGGTWADAGHSGTGLSVAVTGLTANTSYEVQVKATNAEGTSAWSATATAMTTAAANAAPTFSSANTFSVAENETTVGTVVATDADASDSISGYAISGGADQGKFSIDTNGALTFKSAPNYEAPTDAGTDNTYAVEVTATGGTSTRALTATQTITVTVTDVAEPPSAPATPTVSAVTADGFTVSWTAPTNTGPAILDYTVRYREAPSGTWQRQSGITGTSLALTGLSGATAYQVNVRVRNAEDRSNWSPQASATTLAPNAAPTFSSANTFSVAENETTVGTVVATDADASDSISGYAISGGADQGKFSIDTNGALTFKSAPNYEAPTDAGTDNTYAVAVTATSGTSPRVLTATQAITVTVTDVNEPPSAPATPTISAVTASGFTVSWTAPANPGPAITAYAVQYRVSGGTWADAGHSGTGLSVAVTGLTANTSYEVQVKATNAEGTSAWSATATAMTTAAANAAPTFSSANTFSVAENETTVGTVVATDADASDSISGYAISGGADQGKFSIDTNGALTFKSAPNYEAPTDAGTDNTYAVEVTATGGTSTRALTATQTITVTVTDVAEPPSAPATPTISAVTETGFTVSWTAPANTGPAITAYAVQYRVSGGTWADAGHSGTGLSVAVTGLTANTSYEVQVKATNAEGHECLVGHGHGDDHGGAERGADVQQCQHLQRGGE